MGERKNRRNAVIISLIGAVAVVVAASIPAITSKTSSAKFNSESNEGTINYIEGDYKEYNEIPEKDTEAVLVFQLIGTQNSKLITVIQREKKIRVDANAKHLIEVGYSGSILPLADSHTIYYYTGGSIIIKINGAFCYEFEEFRINSLRSNPRNKLEQEIGIIIDHYISLHHQKIGNKIIECVI